MIPNGPSVTEPFMSYASNFVQRKQNQYNCRGNQRESGVEYYAYLTLVPRRGIWPIGGFQPGPGGPGFGPRSQGCPIGACPCCCDGFQLDAEVGHDPVGIFLNCRLRCQNRQIADVMMRSNSTPTPAAMPITRPLCCSIQDPISLPKLEPLH